MRVKIILLALVFVFLVLAGSGAAHAEIEYWHGPGWYMICEDLAFNAGIMAGPYTGEAECKAVLWGDDDVCMYYCEYVDAENLQYYEHYY